MSNIVDENDIYYEYEEKYNDDCNDYDDYNDCNEENRIGIPIQTSNTFYSDFIGQFNKYINITDNNRHNHNNYNNDSNNNIMFRNIIKRNNKYYINTIYGDLYTGNDYNNLVKINIKQIYIFDVSSDGNTIVFVVDNEVHMYSLKTETTEILKLDVCQDEKNKYIKQIMFSPDNNRIIFCQNEYIYVWNINENKLEYKIDEIVINFTADDNYILISYYDKLSVYHIGKKTIVSNDNFENNIIKEMKIIKNTIIIGFIDGTIIIMDLINNNNTNNKNKKYFRHNYSGIKCMTISEDNNYMACVDNYDMLSMFDINKQQHIYSLSGFRVTDIIINSYSEIIGTGHFNSISHFVMPDGFINNSNIDS
jgi:hypothetical protein